jgi:hypothetical protein
MSSFEFVFSLLVILLGLGLAQVLGGLASAVKRRPALSVGWGSGLLAAWVMAETVIFWQIIWRARDALPGTSTSLFAGFVVTALYFFAGAMVFPDDLDLREDLDDHFMQMKAKVVGAVLAAIALSFLFRQLVLGKASWSLLTWFDWSSLAVIYALGPILMLTNRRRLAISCLTMLVVLDVLEPVAEALWPS